VSFTALKLNIGHDQWLFGQWALSNHQLPCASEWSVAQRKPLKLKEQCCTCISGYANNEKANKYTAHHHWHSTGAVTRLVEAKLPYSVTLKDMPNIDDKGTLQRTTT